MKKSDLIDRVAEKAETTRAAAARMVEAIFDATSGAIAEAVKAGSQVSIPGFGKFKPKTRSARKGRNPKTGAAINIPERTVVAFAPGKGLRDTLTGDKSPKRSRKATAGSTRSGSSKAGAAAKTKAGATKAKAQAGATKSRAKRAGGSTKAAGTAKRAPAKKK
jgi:DNA-binding protein HU-beta